jgi:hypothetical protein
MNPFALEQRQALAPGTPLDRGSLTTPLAPSVATVDPMLDAFLKSAAANAIRKIATYTDLGSVNVPSLAVVSPIISNAADLFAQGQYTAALAQAFVAYQNIAALRAAVPEITDLPAL